MKHLVKKLVFYLSIVLMSPVLVLYWLLKNFSRSDSIFHSFSQVLSLLPGKSGSYLRVGFYFYTMGQCHKDLRVGFYRLAMSKCGKDVFISFMVIFAQRNTEIESGVYLGPGCNIGLCRIGKNTLLGSGVHIISGKKQHRFDNPDEYIKDQEGVLEKISIGEDCWIGNGSLILANVGDKCVVGAGSVVTSEMPAYSIVAGNPAKVIRSRNK